MSRIRLATSLMIVALFLSACGTFLSPAPTPTPTAIPTPTPIPPTPKPTGIPQCLFKITGSNGETVAKLCITGGDVSFDADQNIAQGAGFIQAEPGKFYHLLFVTGCSENYLQLRLGMSWLEWDDNGMTVNIRGLEPIVESSSGNKYEITSDLANPTVDSGMLKITIKDKGDFSFLIRFDGSGDRLRLGQSGCPFFEAPPK